jgi:hypothetical protein
MLDGDESKRQYASKTNWSHDVEASGIQVLPGTSVDHGLQGRINFLGKGESKHFFVVATLLWAGEASFQKKRCGCLLSRSTILMWAISRVNETRTLFEHFEPNWNSRIGEPLQALNVY